MQLIHDARARLHHAVPVPQQLPQIAVLPACYPDPRKIILQQQVQNVLGILAIGFLFAYPLGADLGGVPDPQLDVQLCQQSFKPACVSTGFHPHAHFHSLGRQVTVKLLRYFRMRQSPLSQFPSFGIHKSNLLEARMIITTYNNHVGSFLPGLGCLAPPKSIPAPEPTLLWNHYTL